MKFINPRHKRGFSFKGTTKSCAPRWHVDTSFNDGRQTRDGPRHSGVNMRTRLWSAVSAAVANASLAVFVCAGETWTVTRVARVPDNVSLIVSFVNASSFAGDVKVGGIGHAAVWGRPDMALVDLHPVGASSSWVAGQSGNQQGGCAYFAGNIHAGVWHGSSDSWTDLQPTGAEYSWVEGAGGSQQVGSVKFPNETWPRASMWTGSTGSWVDLSPAGYHISFAHGTDGFTQVGRAYSPWESNAHAGLWRGSADTWVDLHPAGLHSSAALVVQGNQQAGYARYDIGGDHACVWSGTADSWIDLMPKGAVDSRAERVYGGWQIGYTDFGDGRWKNSLWHGTAESWEDITASLPPEWDDGGGADLWTDEQRLYLGGIVRERATQDYYFAVLSRPIPEPGGVALLGLAGGLVRRRRAR